MHEVKQAAAVESSGVGGCKTQDSVGIGEPAQQRSCRGDFRGGFRQAKKSPSEEIARVQKASPSGRIGLKVASRAVDLADDIVGFVIRRRPKAGRKATEVAVGKEESGERETTFRRFTASAVPAVGVQNRTVPSPTDRNGVFDREEEEASILCGACVVL
ncbi:hypothetical protein U1Q18_025219 [Sarracenia purpurea var. burkii]